MIILMVLIVLLGPSLYFTFILRGVQVRRLSEGLRRGMVPRHRTRRDGELTDYQGLMVGLAGGAAAGGLIGPAAALVLAGAGALPWMVVGALLAMALLYAEALLGRHYHGPDPRGGMAGGPMYYVSEGLRGRFGRAMATTFAVAAMVAAAGLAFLSAAYVADVLSARWRVHALATAVIFAALMALVLRGGVGTLGRTVGIIVPTALALWLVRLAGEVAEQWELLRAVAGGVIRESTLGADPWTVGVGLAAGLLSTLAGTGTAGIVGGAGSSRSGPAQGVVAMIQALVGTVVLGSITGLLLVANGFEAGTQPGWTAEALRPPLVLEGVLLSLGIAAAWSYYGDRSAGYLLDARSTALYRFLFLVALFAGAAAVQLDRLEVLIPIGLVTLVAGAVMILINMGGVLLLTGVLARETGRAAGGDAEAE